MVTLLTIVMSLSVGSVAIPFSVTWKAIAGQIPFLQRLTGEKVSGRYLTILFNLRLPRILLAMLVGTGLATAGCIMQGLFRNPMASPYITGVSSGSSLGATVALLIFPAFFSVPLLAFVFGAGTILLVYRISWKRGKVAVESLLLAGIAVGFFFSAVTSLLMYTAAESLHRVIFWIMGGLWNRGWKDLLMVVPFVGFGLPATFFFARDLNILQLGEESASHLGVEVEKTKRILLVLASLVTASVVSVSGIIGFVGLIVPHITRMLVGPDHRLLIPVTAFAGGIFLVWCDTLARTVIAPVELPVGVITSCFGAPFFIYLLIKAKRG